MQNDTGIIAYQGNGGGLPEAGHDPKLFYFVPNSGKWNPQAYRFSAGYETREAAQAAGVAWLGRVDRKAWGVPG